MGDVMAGNKTTAADSALNGLSGKALSRARRAAMSSGGKAGLGQVNTASNARSQARIRPSETVSMPASGHSAAAGMLAATGLSQSSELSGSDCGCKGKDSASDAERDYAIEEICSIVDNEPGVLVGQVGSAVRQLCKQRRQALSSRGKTAIKSFRMTAAQGSGLSGRAAARARREALCESGRGNDPVCRPSGRVRPATSVKKVGFDTTLSGNTVSGSELERKGRITGVEFGSCRAITGTEYVGAEQYGALCDSIPPASPAKVGVGMTGRGQRVSGVDGVRGERVTGTVVSANKAVTGNDYLSVDKFESSATTRPAPAKVGISTTRSGKSVSGSEVGRSSKVTGDEPGSCLSISGNQYIGAEQSGALCVSNSPAKVGMGMTGRGQRVSGVDAGREQVTGTKVAANKAVTGNEYLSVDKFEASATSWLQPVKVGMSITRAGMGISGTEIGRSINVTGDEYGSCLPISGNQYSGSEQFDSFCDATQQAASRALLVSRGARAVSGTGQMKMTKGQITGATKGADMVLSGTPYSSTSQRVSERGANANPHPLTRGPANIRRDPAVVQQMPTQQGSFSIVAPARSAQQDNGNSSRISGTAYSATSRITGPVNLANGLVSGTPEFRHHDGVAPAMAPARAAEPQAESARNRVSGDGREGGRAITGAAWRRNEKVSGTEGNSTQRNPTIRGAQGGGMSGAAQMKQRERAELPIGKVTGSSGTDAKGSSITYSGGARG